MTSLFGNVASISLQTIQNQLRRLTFKVSNVDASISANTTDITTNKNRIGGQEYYTYSASFDNTLRKLDTNGNEVWKFDKFDSDVRGVTSDAEGFVYACGFDQSVRKISSTGVEIWSFKGHTGIVYDVKVDADGNVYSASGDGSVRKISSTGVEIWSFKGHTGGVFCLSPVKGGYIYSGGDDNIIYKINITNGSSPRSFSGHTGNILGVTTDSNDNIISASVDGTVRKFNPISTQLWSFTASGSIVFDVAVDSNANVYCAFEDSSVRKLDPDGVEIWNFTGHTGFVRAVTVDENNNIYSGGDDNTVRKISSTGVEIWSFTGHGFGIANLATSSVSNTIAKNAQDINASTQAIQSVQNSVTALQRTNYAFDVGNTSQAVFLTIPLPDSTTVSLSGAISIQAKAPTYTNTGQIHTWEYYHNVHSNADGSFKEDRLEENKLGNTVNITIGCGFSNDKMFLKVNNLDGQDYNANGYVNYHFGHEYRDFDVE